MADEEKKEAQEEPKPEEISDEDLDNVSGGARCSSHNPQTNVKGKNAITY